MARPKTATKRKPGRPRKTAVAVPGAPSVPNPAPGPSRVPNDGLTIDTSVFAKPDAPRFFGDPPQPQESIAQASERLVSTLERDEPARRGPGRPRKADMQLQEQAAQNAARDQRVAVLSTALTATCGALVERWDMQPPFRPEAGRAIAEAWDPVIALYLDRGGPWVNALLTTSVVFLPYILQGAARAQARRATENAKRERLTGGATGFGKNNTGEETDPARASGDSV